MTPDRVAEDDILRAVPALLKLARMVAEYAAADFFNGWEPDGQTWRHMTADMKAALAELAEAVLP